MRKATVANKAKTALLCENTMPCVQHELPLTAMSLAQGSGTTVNFSSFVGPNP